MKKEKFIHSELNSDYSKSSQYVGNGKVTSEPEQWLIEEVSDSEHYYYYDNEEDYEHDLSLLIEKEKPLYNFIDTINGIDYEFEPLKNLSDMIKHIEENKFNLNSGGIFQDTNPIIEYEIKNGKLIWKPI